MRMSHDSVEIVRQAVAALNARDVERYLELCTPDVELVSPVAPLEGANTGVEGIRAFFAGLDEGANAFRLELERLHQREDGRVVALTCVHVESKGGAAFDQPGANVYELEGGRLRRIRVYLHRDECLEAKALLA
jgi:ketosteroid isomerase-like protein